MTRLHKTLLSALMLVAIAAGGLFVLQQLQHQSDRAALIHAQQAQRQAQADQQAQQAAAAAAQRLAAAPRVPVSCDPTSQASCFYSSDGATVSAATLATCSDLGPNAGHVVELYSCPRLD